MDLSNSTRAVTAHLFFFLSTLCLGLLVPVLFLYFFLVDFLNSFLNKCCRGESPSSLVKKKQANGQHIKHAFSFYVHKLRVLALFRCQKILDFATVALSFVCDKYCLIIN